MYKPALYTIHLTPSTLLPCYQPTLQKHHNTKTQCAPKINTIVIHVSSAPKKPHSPSMSLPASTFCYNLLGTCHASATSPSTQRLTTQSAIHGRRCFGCQTVRRSRFGTFMYCSLKTNLHTCYEPHHLIPESATRRVQMLCLGNLNTCRRVSKSCFAA